MAKPEAAKKKRPTPKKRLGLAAQLKHAPKKPNPFEQKNTKTNFETLGRRTKGAKKNVLAARAEAIDKRKKTLLVEYKSLRKANAFVDRRFGEENGRIATSDDRAFSRQRVLAAPASKKSAGRAKFALGGDDGEDGGLMLTHMGRSLSDNDNLGEAPEEDEVDEELAAEFAKEYNFGGGDEDRAMGPDGKPKTRKQVMEEIIAKSKAFKAARMKQREEDEEAREALDGQYRDLIRGAALGNLRKPVGFTKDNKTKAETAEDARYDIAARELAFEAKGAAGERTMSAEELEEKERARLEKLEKERVKRMRADPQDLPEEEEGAGRRRRKGAKASSEEDDDGLEDSDDDARPKRRRGEAPSGDALGNDFDNDTASDEGEGSGSEDGSGPNLTGGGLTRLEIRRMQRAAGDHPLQDSFRGQVAKLLSKHKLVSSNPFRQGQDDAGSSEDGADDDESGDGEGESEELEEGEEESGDEGEADDAENGSGGGEGELAQGESGSDEDDEGEDNMSGSGSEDLARSPHAARTSAAAPDQDLLPHPSKPNRNKAIAAAASINAQSKDLTTATLPTTMPAQLPFTINMPVSYEKFAAMVAGRSAAELATAIQRIRVCNAPVLVQDSKRKLQELFGMLVQHFALLAGQVPIPTAHLDALLAPLLAATTEVPFYAATVARARLLRIHERLTASLAASSAAVVATHVSANVAASVNGQPPGPVTAAATACAAVTSAWPGARAVLQLQLFTTLFPTTDRRHPVVTPAALLLGQCLSQCVVNSTSDAATGLACTTILLRVCLPARRHCPEAITFLTDTLTAFACNSSSASSSSLTATPSSPPLQEHGQTAASTAATSTEAAIRPEADTGHAFVRFAPGVLSLVASSSSEPLQDPSVPLDIYTALAHSQHHQVAAGARPDQPPPPQSTGFKLGLLQVALHTLKKAVEALSSGNSLVNGGVSVDSLPELLHPPLTALERLGVAVHLPSKVEALRADVHAALATVRARVLSMRQPMVQANRSHAPAVREYNPRFEEDYEKGHDYDPDRERAEARKLKRVHAKEKRGAMRELRRDAAFMAAERESEKAVVDAERLDSQRKFYAVLEQQASDLRSGGQGGMNQHLKGRARSGRGRGRGRG